MKAGRSPLGLKIGMFAVALSFVVTLSSVPAAARSMSISAGQFVNVNVGFNTQKPLADVGEDALLEAQQSGRKLIYNMAIKECAVLIATIAKTCRLTNLNISAQVREYGNMPPTLQLNGNAQFVITLKDDGPG